MKNIHVLPTDKPTWLHKSNLTGILRKFSYCINDMKQAQGMHIYITSDEEIKEGDWFLDDNNSIGQSYKLSHVQFANPKKIILTTDQDLIKDGVQAIDDEFLEWFVAHPSCEEVKVFRNSREVGYDTLGNSHIEYSNYSIVIPQEEPKQETIKIACVQCCGTGEIQKSTNRKQSNFECDLCNGRGHWNKIIEPKQETTSKGFHRIFKETDYREFDFVSFKIGAKWQQEQTLDFLYSEITERRDYSASKMCEKVIEFIEQFKKK
jgi:hypothetical protein